MTGSTIPDTALFTGLSDADWSDADWSGTGGSGEEWEFDLLDSDVAYAGLSADELAVGEAWPWEGDLGHDGLFGTDADGGTVPPADDPFAGSGTLLADGRLDGNGVALAGAGDTASDGSNGSSTTGGSNGSDAGGSPDALQWRILEDERFGLESGERSWESTFEQIDLLDVGTDEPAPEPTWWAPWTWRREADEGKWGLLDEESGARLERLLESGTERWLPDFLPRSADLTLPARDPDYALGTPGEPRLYAVDGIAVQLAPGRGERLPFVDELPSPPDGRLRTGGTYTFTEDYELFNGKIFNVGTALTTSADGSTTPGSEARPVVREGESPVADRRGILFQREDGSIGIGRADGDTLADIQRDFGGKEIEGPTEAQIRAFNPYLPEELRLPESGSPVTEAIGGYALLYEGGRPTTDLGVPSDAGGQGFTDGLRSAQLGEVTNRTVFAELSSGHVVTIVIPSQIAEDGTELGMDAAELQDYLGALEIPVAGQETPATVVNAVTGDAGTPHYAEEFGLSDGGDGTPRDLPVIRGRGRSDLIDGYGPNTLIDIEVGETREEDGTGSLSEGVDGDAELSPGQPSGR